MYSERQIVLAAASLFEPGETIQAYGGSEYQRGVCELLGRLKLDFGLSGEGTGENAEIYAAKITKILAVRP